MAIARNPRWTDGSRLRHTEVTAEQAKELARACVLNALAAVQQIAGDLDRIARVVKAVGYVASAPDFTGRPGVINGASELLGEVLGGRDIHARSVVGVAVLPLNAPVEVEIQFELSDGDDRPPARSLIAEQAARGCRGETSAPSAHVPCG